jgi:viologen exporter family transport system permease protein
MSRLGLAWELEKAAFRGQLAYRVDFVVLTLMGVAYQGSGFAVIWVMLHRFHSIGGWTLSDLAVLYSMRLLAHAAWLVPLNRLTFLDNMVREGDFDRYLIRPLNPLVQIMTSRFEMNVIGDIVTATGFFAVTAVVAHVSFSPLHVVYLILAVIGGGLAEASVVLAISSLSFRVVQVWAAQYLADQVFLMFGSYPMRVFGRVTGWVLTWLVPVAFVAYIPSGVLLNRVGGLHVPAPFAWGAPLVGAVWFYAAYRLWCWQVRGYQSTGT